MPTPNSFNIIAQKASPYKGYYLGMAGMGVTLILIALLAAIKFQKNSFPIIGAGSLFMVWGWGVFLIVNWYGKESRFISKLPVFLRVGLSWSAAIFLDLWFISGSVASMIFIWNSM